MKKITLLIAFFLTIVTGSYAQTIVIGTGTATTLGTGSDPVDGYFEAMRYQVVYTAAELSASLTPYDQITALGFSVDEDYAGGALLGYTIKMGHTVATNSATHDASVTSIVKNAFDYDPTVTAAGVFDMIIFDTPFVWNGVDNIVIDICTDGPNPFTSPYGGVRVTTVANGSRVFRVDGGTACGTNTGAINGNRPNIQFNYTEGTPPACSAPLGLVASAITSSSATTTWTATTGNYEYVLDTNAADPAGSGTVLAGETYNATLLTPVTTYYFHVRSVCTGPTYSAWSTVSFATTCVPYTIPYFEGFEAGYTHNTPVTGCLSQETVTGTQVWTANASLTTFNRAPRTGTWNAFLQYGNEDWIFIPINLVGGTSYTASLFARQDDVTATDADMTISYGTAANSASMTNAIVAATGIINGGYQQIIGSFTPATTGTYYVGIKGFMNGTPWYISLDDISIEVTPSCANPLGLVASAITDASATTTWTATTGNYEYVLDTNAADPAASGTVLAGETYNATLLAPSTTYYFHVRSVCAGPTYSTWSTVSFTTACAPVTAFTENFDGAVAPAFPNCWARVGTGGNANIQTTNPSSGINTMYLYSPTTTSLGVVKTIPVSNLGAGTHRLNFKMRGNFTAGDDVEVGYLTDPNAAASFISLGSVNAASLTYADYTFTPPAGAYSNYLAFRHTGTIGASVLIDDVVWEPIPACNNPSALTVSLLTSVSATVTWTATTGNYEYVLDTNAADPAGAGTVLVGETYSATLLTPETTYYFHVRTDCGAGSFSTWTTISFTTLATPPANDDCAGATVLTPAVDYATGNILASKLGATNSEVADPLIPAPGCASYIGGDVWFSAVVPASGSITFETAGEPGSYTDGGLAVYSGTCGALVLEGCDDDSGVGSFELIALTGRTAGETLYARVWRYNNAASREILAAGDFRIAAYDATLSAQSFDLTGFAAYPNPVKDVLNLSYTKEISNVSVHNLLGQEVMTKTINATQSKIDMSNLANGTYLVKVTVDGLVKTLKVVKE